MNKNITNKCPFCGKIGRECTELIVKKVRGASVLLACENEHFWGRFT